MWPTEATYPLLFASGFLGGFGHCLPMCGPVAATLPRRLGGDRPLLPHLLYNLGRVTTYGLIGGTVGATGSFLGVAAGLATFQKAVLVITGLLVAAMGLSLAGWLPRRIVPEGRFPAEGAFSRLVRAIADGGTPGACFPLGLLLGFLPCGLVYAALLSAAREGMEAAGPAEGFLRGLLAMVLFGCGTVPALLLVGKAAGFLSRTTRALLYRAAALVMVGTGVVFVIRGLLG